MLPGEQRRSGAQREPRSGSSTATKAAPPVAGRGMAAVRRRKEEKVKCGRVAGAQVVI